jgi:Domain of unknown function (DUF3291)
MENLKWKTISGDVRHRFKREEQMRTMNIAQINLARMKTAFEDPIMASFVARLDEINALADRSPGFVWRLQTSDGNATALRPYEDDRILINMSVWETIEDLKHYVYNTAHNELLRGRHTWFEKLSSTYIALWWIPKGHIPSIDEAKMRLRYLEEHGPTPIAFTFKEAFPPDDALIENLVLPS